MKVKPASVFQPGDLVMLNGKNLKTRRPARMLDAKLHGLSKVMKVVSRTAFKQKLPSQWRIHNALHVSLIEHLCIATNLIQDQPGLDRTMMD